MNVGGTAIMPDEGRALQSPDVPGFIIADISGLIEGDSALVQSTLGINALAHFLLV